MNIAEALTPQAFAGVDRRELRLLLAEASGLSEAAVLAHPQQVLSANAAATLLDWVARRRKGEPLAYLIGWREFYGLKLDVSPAVLIPRPETELLVELALRHLSSGEGASVLDLGTGSGAIALAIKANRPQVRVLAVDASAEALQIAQGNAARLGIEVEFRRGSWFAPVVGERYHLVVSNPPYVAEGDPHLWQGDLPHEPQLALMAGTDGLEALREIARGAPHHLRKEGWLLLEHGYDQAEPVRALLARSLFEEISTWPDLAGIARVTGGQYNPDKFTRV